MIDMECEVLITQDEAWRRGSTVPLKRPPTRRWTTRRAIRASVVLRAPATTCRCRTAATTGGTSSRTACRDDAASCPCEPMDSEDLLFLMYTSGTTAKPKGIVHTTGGYLVRRRDDAPLHLRPEARHRRLLVRRRHRLDHRAQLHRLRAALQRRDVGALRGHAGLPGQGPLVGDRRALRRDDPLHGADRDPRAHEVGAGARAAARPLVAAAARLGRRADQPGGVDLVPRARRRRPHADRRHVVADRDRDGPDHAAAGRDDDEARLGDEAVPRRRGRRLRRAAATRSARAAAAISC